MKLKGILEAATAAASAFWLIFSVGQASSVTFSAVNEQSFGSWSAGLFRNPEGDRLFCSFTGRDGDSVFRVVRYLASGDTFLEVFNNKWKLLPGKGELNMDLHLAEGPISIVLSVTREAHAYIFEFDEEDKYLMILGAVSKSTRLKLRNANGKELFEIKGPGADEALKAYGACVRGKMNQ